MNTGRTIPWYVPHIVFILAGIIVFGVAFNISLEDRTKLWADIIKDFGVVITALAVTDIVWKLVGGDPVTAEITQLRDDLSRQVQLLSTKPATDDRDAERTRIEGEYHTNDNRQYAVSIIPLSGSYYRIENKEWEGVGLFDEEFYYGVYRVKDDASVEIRGKWGAHRARFRKRDKRLELFGVEVIGDQRNAEFFKRDAAWIRDK